MLFGLNNSTFLASSKTATSFQFLIAMLSVYSVLYFFATDK